MHAMHEDYATLQTIRNASEIMLFIGVTWKNDTSEVEILEKEEVSTTRRPEHASSKRLFSSNNKHAVKTPTTNAICSPGTYNVHRVKPNNVVRCCCLFNQEFRI